VVSASSEPLASSRHEVNVTFYALRMRGQTLVAAEAAQNRLPVPPLKLGSLHRVPASEAAVFLLPFCAHLWFVEEEGRKHEQRKGG